MNEDSSDEHRVIAQLFEPNFVNTWAVRFEPPLPDFVPAEERGRIGRLLTEYRPTSLTYMLVDEKGEPTKNLLFCRQDHSDSIVAGSMKRQFDSPMELSLVYSLSVCRIPKK